MKKSLVVFSLIGLVAMGMSLSSCSKETKPTKINAQNEQVLADFTQFGMNLTISEMRDYTEAYIKLINTILTDKEEKIILTMQCSMQYYIFAFWKTEGAKQL